MLAQGPSQEANVRDAPMEIRGLFHHVWLGIQRRHSLLNNHRCFTKPAAFLFLHFKNQVFSTTLCYPHPLIMKWHNKRHTYFTQYDIELQAKPISGCDISSLSPPCPVFIGLQLFLLLPKKTENSLFVNSIWWSSNRRLYIFLLCDNKKYEFLLTILKFFLLLISRNNLQFSPR